MKSKFFPALAVFIGTIVGAGFLGIPYVISKSGFIVGFLYLVFIAAFILLIKLYLGEVALRTHGSHQLTGYAEKYLGKKGKFVMFLAMIFGIFPALLAYMIAESKSLSYALFGNFNYTLYCALVFWIIMAGLTFIGLRALKKYERIVLVLVMFLFILIFGFFVNKVDYTNFLYTGEDIFAPFGVIMFSFLGFSCLPEIRRILFGQGEKMKEVIFIGVLLTFLIYLVFSFILVGVYGRDVSEIATISLGRVFSILGVFTAFTAFFSSTIAIRDVFRFDYGIKRTYAWAIACIIPLIFFLLIHFFDGLSFTEILGIGGVISGGLTGVLILFMNKRAKIKGDRNPEYSIPINIEVILLLSAIFVFAVVLELVF